jgi:hypothetical protein
MKSFKEIQVRTKTLLSNIILWLRNLLLSPVQLYTWPIAQRKLMQKILDLYSGIQLRYLNITLNEQFTNSLSLKLQPQFINIVKKITDEIAMTFKSGISVKSINKDDQEIVDEICDSSNLDAVMQEVDRKCFLVKQCFVKINYNDGIKLDIITPQYVAITCPDDDPYTFDSIMYPKEITHPSIELPRGTFCYYDSSSFSMMNEAGMAIVNPDNLDNVNPYSPTIPLVVFRESLPTEGTFLLTMPEDLINATDNINVKLTFLNRLIKFQSFGVPVVTNPQLTETGKVQLEIAVDHPIVLIQQDKDTPSDFKFVSPDAKILEIEDVIDKDIARIANNYSINPDDLIASKLRSTSDSKNAGNAKLNEVRDMRKLILVPTIIELWKKIIVVWNVNNPNRKLSEDGVIVKVNNSKRLYETVDDYIKQKTFELENNLSTPIDWMIENADDLTRDEAIQRINDNIEEIAMLSVVEPLQLTESSSISTSNTVLPVSSSDAPITGSSANV